MKTIPLPPVERLRQLLSYDAERGVLLWRPRTSADFASSKRPSNTCAVWNARYADGPALNMETDKGYRSGKIDGGSYLAHRVIWKLVHGVDPLFIDHINGNGLDNRLANLRSVSWEENTKNRSRPRNNTSGHIGVHWCNTNRKWIAQIRPVGCNTQRWIGAFDNLEDAVAARLKAQREQGFHVNHGRTA